MSSFGSRFIARCLPPLKLWKWKLFWPTFPCFSCQRSTVQGQHYVCCCFQIICGKASLAYPYNKSPVTNQMNCQTSNCPIEEKNYIFFSCCKIHQSQSKTVNFSTKSNQVYTLFRTVKICTCFLYNCFMVLWLLKFCPLKNFVFFLNVSNSWM